MNLSGNESLHSQGRRLQFRKLFFPNIDGDEAPKVPSKLGREYLFEHGTPPPSLQERGEALLRWLQSSPSIVRNQMVELEGKTEHQIDQLMTELIRWRDADFPNLQEWPLSPLCLSELGLDGKYPKKSQSHNSQANGEPSSLPSSISNVGVPEKPSGKSCRRYMLRYGIPPPSLSNRAKILLRWLKESPTVRSWMIGEGKTEHDLSELEKELLRWKEAGFPNLRQWPLSSLCLSELRCS